MFTGSGNSVFAGFGSFGPQDLHPLQSPGKLHEHFWPQGFAFVWHHDAHLNPGGGLSFSQLGHAEQSFPSQVHFSSQETGLDAHQLSQRPVAGVVPIVTLVEVVAGVVPIVKLVEVAGVVLIVTLVGVDVMADVVPLFRLVVLTMHSAHPEQRALQVHFLLQGRLFLAHMLLQGPLAVVVPVFTLVEVIAEAVVVRSVTLVVVLAGTHA